MISAGLLLSFAVDRGAHQIFVGDRVVEEDVVSLLDRRRHEGDIGVSRFAGRRGNQWLVTTVDDLQALLIELDPSDAPVRVARPAVVKHHGTTRLEEQHGTGTEVPLVPLPGTCFEGGVATCPRTVHGGSCGYGI